MEQYKVGAIFDGENNTVIYQDADGNFINDQSEILDWVHWLNNPWSNTSFDYSVFPNYENSKEYICQKSVIVYDTIEVMIEARGKTPQKAISNCEKLLKKLTKKYYSAETENNGKNSNCN